MGHWQRHGRERKSKWRSVWRGKRGEQNRDEKRELRMKRTDRRERRERINLIKKLYNSATVPSYI